MDDARTTTTSVLPSSIRTFLFSQPRAVIALVLFVLVSGVQHLSLIDPRLTRCLSVPGLTGLCQYLSGNLVQAAQSYRTHYESAGERARVRLSPDYVVLLMGDLRTAETTARRMVEEHPEGLEPRLTLAEIALRRDDRSEALRWTREVTDHNQADFDALLLASVAHARLREYTEAIQCLHQALRNDYRETRVTSLLTAMEAAGQLARLPKGERPWALLAQYHRYLRIADPAQGSRVIACAKQAIARQDHPADAWLAMGVVYDKREQRRKAQAVLQKAVEADPGHPEALRWTARLYGKAGDLVRELEFTRRAMAAAPEDPFYVGVLNYVLTEKLGDYREALTLALENFARDPRDATGAWRVAWAYQVVGDSAHAVEFYQEAIRLNPKLLKPWLGLGDNLVTLGRPEEAMVAYRQAELLEPDSFEPKREIASLLIDQRRYPEAILAYEQAFQLGDSDVNDLSTLCGLYYAASRFQESAGCFQQVLRLDPADMRALRLLPEVMDNLRRTAAQ